MLIAIGAFLRFYHAEGFVTFLGDQGRDAAIMMRIAKLQHFPAVGAPSSVGMVFLGPFFYYLMAPWLLLFNFDPIGPAIGVGVLSLAGTVLAYFMTRDLFGRKVAILTSMFLLFSHSIVELSRFSWNPNLLAFFSLFSIYFFIKALKTRKTSFFMSAGLCMSFAMQLHYVMLALFPPLAMGIMYYLITSQKEKLKHIRNTLLLIGSFLLGSAPLIIFDVRHGFLNFKNFLEIITVSNKAAGSNGLSEILRTFSFLNAHLFGFVMTENMSLLLLLIFLLTTVLVIQKSKTLAYVLFTFLSGLVITAFFTTEKHSHYFGALFPLYFIVISYVVTKVFWVSKREILIAVFVLIFTLSQSQRYYFLTGTPNYQIQKGQHIAKVIYDNVKASQYQITGVPDMYDDSVYRYFLELWGKKPLEKNSIEKGNELFAICEHTCNPLKAPQWSVTFFAPTKIIEKWSAENVTIYKLVR